MRDLSIENTPVKKPIIVFEYQDDHIGLKNDCKHKEPESAKKKLD